MQGNNRSEILLKRQKYGVIIEFILKFLPKAGRSAKF